MSEIISQSLTRLLELIRSRSLSPVEVVQAHLDRIEEINPPLNAVVTLASDAMHNANEAEIAMMRGDAAAALSGIPITVKDTIETAGIRSTSGSMMREQFIPERDATAVARVKAAGAIILAKTNPAEMAMEYTGDNPVFGRTNNPFDRTRTPGGSSGGEAVAITTCMSPGGLGTDLAGSIRVPSHFCGIAGLRPTVGRIPGDGQFPPSTGPYSLGAVIGPMGRTVADLELMFSVLADVRVPAVQLKGLQAASYCDDGVVPVTQETCDAVTAAATALNDAGMIVRDERPPAVDRGHEFWLKLFSRASVVHLRNVYEGNEEKGGPFVRWRLRTADDNPVPTLDEYIQYWIERDQLRDKLLEWMVDTPLLVAPVGAVPALQHDVLKVTVDGNTFSAFRAFSYAQTFSAFDFPVVTVPAGRSSDELPIGVQIVGKPFQEAQVFAAARIVEEALGGWRRPPDRGGAV